MLILDDIHISRVSPIKVHSKKSFFEELGKNKL